MALSGKLINAQLLDVFFYWIAAIRDQDDMTLVHCVCLCWHIVGVGHRMWLSVDNALREDTGSFLCEFDTHQINM